MTQPADSIWKFYLPLIALTAILVLQNTKQAMLPAKQTPVLWAAEIAVIVGVLVLRSGLGARQSLDAKRRPSSARSPTTSTSRAARALSNGVRDRRRRVRRRSGGRPRRGPSCSRGMRRNVVARGLVDFEVAALAGAIAGGVDRRGARAARATSGKRVIVGAGSPTDARHA